MTIVAEGIEREEQLHELLARGVTSGQGYLVAPPLPVPAFISFMEARDAADMAGPSRSIRAA
jgi:c-di-GMP phosphodiesterase